jgi:hypothetical protein
MRTFPLLVATIALTGQPTFADEIQLRKAAQQLSAILEWEILWDESPEGFHRPNGGSAKLAIQLTADSLTYCSHDLGACVAYAILDYRNWLGVRSAKCDDTHSDLDALLAFIGNGPRNRANSQSTGATKGLADGRTMVGLSPTGSGIIWTTTVSLGSRDEIAQRYRRMNPDGIQSLRKWAANGVAPGIKAITIPCFAPSDPIVYVSFDWQADPPTAIAVFWNKESETWIDAASFVGPENRETIERIRSVIDEIACATIKPK